MLEWCLIHFYDYYHRVINGLSSLFTYVFSMAWLIIETSIIVVASFIAFLTMRNFIFDVSNFALSRVWEAIQVLYVTQNDNNMYKR